jgi:hypothetical protein
MLIMLISPLLYWNAKIVSFNKTTFGVLVQFHAFVRISLFKKEKVNL